MKDNILYGIIGLLAGIILTWVLSVYAVNNQNEGMMRMMGMKNMQGMHEMMGEKDNITKSGSMMGNEMENMMFGLKDKEDADFDKSFIQEMMVHHNGAIEMAKLAQQKSNREEIKKMANDIIQAQTKEMDTMNGWMNAWFK